MWPRNRAIAGTAQAVTCATVRWSRVTLSLDIRRIGLMLLTLLIAMAVIGPSCLLFASHAFAMPEHAPKGCDGTGSSMDACPHDDEAKSPAVVADTAPLAAVALATGPAVVPTVGDAGIAQTEQPPGAPVAHLTPLRI